MKKILGAVGLLICLTLVSGYASAGFVNEDQGGSVRVLGVVGQDAKVAGLGRNMPLRNAVRQIVPEAYALRFAPGTESFQERLVSWRGGRLWTEVLGDALAAVPDLAAEVDVERRTVVLRSVSEAPNAAASVGVSEWQMRVEDGNVKEAVSRWARIAGWQMVWEVPFEYPIGARASFPGTFENAVSAVIRSMQAAEVPPKVIFYQGNNVVRIVPRGGE